MFLPVAVLFVLIANITASLSIQFPPAPSERTFNVFGSPRSQGYSPPDNSVVIQSKPYNVSTNSSATGDNKIRRNLFIENDDSSEENLTEPKESPYAIDCGADKACLEAHGLDSPEPTFKPYSQEELEKLLAQYTASQGSPPKVGDDSPTNKLANLYMDEEEAVINVLENNSKDKDHEKSKSASWHLVQSQHHNHPYDDHKGWVTLEPVPWAQSQIQKWEPNAKPQIPSWDPPGHQRPTSHWDYKPQQNDYSTERPWGKPSYDYKPSRPQWDQWNKPSEYPERPASQWGGNSDIITDNQPGYFPGPPPSQRPWYDQEPYSSNRPTPLYEERPLHHQTHSSHHDHPSNHPSEGDGQWVLLSSTKGYSVPHRHKYQRAMTFNAKAPAASVSHRTVRLTVLPADNSTNTTLSHDGLLEVESTLQTVEEAQREHAAKMLKLNTLTPEDANPAVEKVRSKNPTSAPSAYKANRRRSGESLQVFSAVPTKPENKAAMLAAIGAGMIPATMAMLLPMVLGRRRRSLDDQEPVNLTNLEILQQEQQPLIRGKHFQTYF